MTKSPLAWLPVASGLLVLVLTLAVAVLTVTTRNVGTSQMTQALPSKASESVASLALSPAGGTYTFTAGQTYPVGIILDTAGKITDGADVIINFDPSRAQVVGTVNPTTLLEKFPINSVDNTKGVIKFSGLTFHPKAMTGILGTFNFKPLAKGEINLTFNFVLGATTDSNIAENGTAKDILGKVVNGNYHFE